MRIYLLIKTRSRLLAPPEKAYYRSINELLYASSIYDRYTLIIDHMFARNPTGPELEVDSNVREFLTKYMYFVEGLENPRIIRNSIKIKALKQPEGVALPSVDIRYVLFSELDVGVGQFYYRNKPVIAEYIAPNSIGIACVEVNDEKLVDTLLKIGCIEDQWSMVKPMGFGYVKIEFLKTDQLVEKLKQLSSIYNRKLEILQLLIQKKT